LVRENPYEPSTSVHTRTAQPDSRDPVWLIDARGLNLRFRAFTIVLATPPAERLVNGAVGAFQGLWRALWDIEGMPCGIGFALAGHRVIGDHGQPRRDPMLAAVMGKLTARGRDDPWRRRRGLPWASRHQPIAAGCQKLSGREKTGLMFRG
jgi:hypothetical protein